MDSQLYCQLISNKAGEIIQWKNVPSLMVLRKLDSDMQKNETGSFSYTIHKDKLQMVERPKCETEINQNPRGEHRQQPL